LGIARSSTPAAGVAGAQRLAGEHRGGQADGDRLLLLSGVATCVRVVATASVVGDGAVWRGAETGYGVMIISSGNHKLTFDSPRRRD
jgi:hypothetical protein